MANKLGNFGKTIKFEVSSDKILTFNKLKRTQSGRWAQHQVLGKPARSEFQGPGLTTASMQVVLSAEHGIKPRSMISKIEKAVRTGQVETLVIGGKVFGWGCKWYIESVSETWDEVWNGGELVKATATLNFTEYR